MDTWFPTFRRLAWPGNRSFGQHRSLLHLIAVATEENLPLAPLVESWAADETGNQRHRLHRLVQLLKDGTPLADAVEQIPGLLRDEEVLAVRFGAQSGALTASVRSMLEESQSAATSRAPHIRQSVLYFCTMGLCGLALVAFHQTRIVPSLHAILGDFSLRQSLILRRSTQLSGFVANYWWLIVLAVFVLLWVTFSARSRRAVSHSIFARFFRPHREKQSADLLEKLSVAIEFGRPIPGALSTLARYHFDPTIRHKLLFVRNEVEQGSDVWQTMATVGLLTAPEVRLMKTAERIGNQPWVLKQLAFVKKRRGMRSLERWSRFAFPALVISMGVFVLLLAFTVFIPLTQLILDLA